jgi:hypothetical protein
MLRKFISIGFQFIEICLLLVSIPQFSPQWFWVKWRISNNTLQGKTHHLLIISEIHSESVKLSQPSEPEEEKFCGRNIVEKSGILSRATSPLSLRSQDSSLSRKAHQVAEGTVLNHCICDKEGLGKTKSKPIRGNKQENRTPCNFWRRDTEACNITEWPKTMKTAWNLHSGRRSEKTWYIFNFHNIKNYQILTCSTAGRAQSHKSSLEKPRASWKPWYGTKIVHFLSIWALLCSEEWNLVLVFMVKKSSNVTLIICIKSS